MNKNKTEKDIKKKWHANIEKIINSDLREDIMHNTKNLLKRNNMNYEVKKLNEFDSIAKLNLFHQTSYPFLLKLYKKI